MNKIYCSKPLVVSLSGSLFLLLLLCGNLRAQTGNLGLKEVVRRAKQQSPAALQAETRKENYYWRYKTYLSDYKPQLVLNADDSYINEVVAAPQPDGTLDYRGVHYNRARMSLSLEQQIGITGSRLFLTSSLDRFDNFLRDNTMYGGNPAFFGIEQPLFRFNDLRWNRKIEPLRYQESEKQYVEQLEAISNNATGLFFDLLLAQASLEISNKNLANNDTIYKIAEGRYNLGKVSEGELLQLELTLMRARQQVAKAELDVETNSLRLKSYIGLAPAEEIELIPPSEIPTFVVDATVALQEASSNRPDMLAFKREQLEAERDFARAKGESGINASVRATFGLTNQGQGLPEVYSSPDDQQAVSLNLSLPLIDWGRQKARVKTAEANKQLVAYTLAQEQVNFEQEIYTQVRKFDMLRQQTVIAAKSDDIAQRRYELSKQRYLIGKISITDLNIATQEKDEARRSYIAALRDFWTAYYLLRELTLYDFQQNAPIVPE